MECRLQVLNGAQMGKNPLARHGLGVLLMVGGRW